MEETKPYSPEYWKGEIRAYEQAYKDWCERARKIVDLYRDSGPQKPEDSKYRFNLFWSNVQTTKPALYSRTPKPVVEERLKDGNPIVRYAAQLWEKAIEFNLKNQRFDDVMDDAVSDYLLTGRGITWTYLDKVDGEVVGQDDDGSELRVPIEMHARTDFVYYKDFGHTVDRRWGEVRAVWRKVYLTRPRFEARFGKDTKVVYDHKPDHLDKDSAKQAEGKACLYEIWCKESRHVYWLHMDMPEFLDAKEDPLSLADFFPCAKGLYATNTTDSLIPLPDYAMTQDLYQQLDKLSKRIARMESAVRVCGARDPGSGELDRLLTEDFEGLVAAKDWPTFLQAGGLSGVMDFLPLDQIVKALEVLYEARDRLKAAIDEITGTSDLVRGATNAAETATAQQIKDNYQNLRISDRQREVQRFARDTVALQAEIIAEHFDPQMIANMAGVDLQNPEIQQKFLAAMQLLRTDRQRRFFVNIETDSTISVDEQAEKQAVSELFQAIGGFLEQFLQFGQMAPEFMPALGQLMVFGMRRFRAGRSVEEAFEQAVEQFLKGQEERSKKGPQEDPAVAQEAQKMQMQAQLEQMKMEQQAQLQQQQAQQEMVKLQAQMDQLRQEMEMRLAELLTEQEKTKQEMALRKYELDQNAALEVTRIKAQAVEAEQQREAQKEAQRELPGKRE